MSKAEFLAALRGALGKLPEQEIRASLDFYAEMIDDRIEDGATEDEAVAALGDVNAIAAQIIAETPPIPKAVAKMKTSSRTANIVLAVVFSPIWVPLALAFALCVAAIYLSLWAVIIGLWLSVACLILCGPVGIIGLIYCLGTGSPPPYRRMDVRLRARRLRFGLVRPGGHESGQQWARPAHQHVRQQDQGPVRAQGARGGSQGEGR